MANPPDIGFANYLLRIVVPDAVDSGHLEDVENYLGLAERQVLEADRSDVAEGTRLSVRIWNATINQHRDQLLDAERFAEDAVAFAEDRFPFGVQVGRARIRRIYVHELQGKFIEARDSAIDLEKRLQGVGGAGSLRLNCLTRALACAAKQQEDAAGAEIVALANPIVLGLNPQSAARRSLRWFFYWCGVEKARQGDPVPAMDLLRLSDKTGFPSWRWTIAHQMVVGHLLDRSGEGGEELDAVRSEARASGFAGLIRSIDDAFQRGGTRG